ETRPLATNLQTRYITCNLDPRPIAASFTPLELINGALERAMETSMTLDHSDWSLLELAKQRLTQFTCVGLTARFRDSVSLLTYIFGWRPTSDIPLINTNPEVSSYQDIPEAVLQAVRECNQLDLELYTYGESLFESYL